MPEVGTESAWEYVRTGDLAPGLDLHFTVAETPWSPPEALGAVPHVVAAIADSSKRSMYFHVRLFGSIDLAGFSEGVACGDWKVGYALDPLRGTEMNAPPSAIGAIGRPIGTADGEYEAVTQKLYNATARIVRFGFERINDAELRRVIVAVVRERVDEHFEPSPENFAAIVDETYRRFAGWRSRAATTTEDRELVERLNKPSNRTSFD